MHGAYTADLLVVIVLLVIFYCGYCCLSGRISKLESGEVGEVVKSGFAPKKRLMAPRRHPAMRSNFVGCC